MTRGTPRKSGSGKAHAKTTVRARTRTGDTGASPRKPAKALVASTVFGPETFAFLRELDRNNDREWFDSNKARYEAHVRAPALHFIAAMGTELAKVTKHFVADARPVGGSLMRINEEVEKRRLQYSFDTLIVSPEMKEIGVGDIKDDRMTRAIGIVVEGYQLERAPAVTEVFSREFLPPKKDRELVYVKN